MRRFLPRFLLGLCLLAAGACGQKGPLYLSDNPPPGSQPSATKAYKPVPYPQRKPDDELQGQKPAR
jgi:predicted small lipoprotein YifL